MPAVQRKRQLSRLAFRLPALLAGLLAATLAAGASEPVAIDPPAAPGASSPALAAEGATTVRKGHDVLLTWLEPGEDGGRLRFARFSGKSWSPPVTIAGQVASLGPGDRPSLTVIDTQGVRRTLIARTGDVIARSGDAGRTWSRLPAPPLPFASFAGADEGAFAFWLRTDGEEGSDVFSSEAPARLLGTRVLAGETLLDERVAGGSATSAAMTWDGPIVVYRDLATDGAHNVAMVRRQDARWTRPRPVHVEAAQPVLEGETGPRVAALRRRVAVAWVSGAPSRRRLLVAFSSDAGRSFGVPYEVAAGEGEPAPPGFVDVALDESGQALLLWTAGDEPAEAVLRLARVSADGRRGETITLARGLDPRSGSPPQLVRAGDRAVATWIEGSPSRVRAAAVPLVEVAAPAGRPSAETASRTAYRGRGRIGETLPELELRSLEGDAVSPSSLAGRPALVNLWATWCLPCIREMPELAALHERYAEQGLSVVGVSIDDAGALDDVHAFIAEHQVPFTTWLDPEMRLYRALRVRALPTTFLLDREGRIVWRRDRAIRADDPELEKALRRLLAEGVTATATGEAAGRTADTDGP